MILVFSVRLARYSPPPFFLAPLTHQLFPTRDAYPHNEEHYTWHRLIRPISWFPRTCHMCREISLFLSHPFSVRLRPLPVGDLPDAAALGLGAALCLLQPLRERRAVKKISLCHTGLYEPQIHDVPLGVDPHAQAPSVLVRPVDQDGIQPPQQLPQQRPPRLIGQRLTRLAALRPFLTVDSYKSADPLSITDGISIKNELWDGHKHFYRHRLCGICYRDKTKHDPQQPDIDSSGASTYHIYSPCPRLADAPNAVKTNRLTDSFVAILAAVGPTPDPWDFGRDSKAVNVLNLFPNASGDWLIKRGHAGCGSDIEGPRVMDRSIKGVAGEPCWLTGFLG